MVPPLGNLASVNKAYVDQTRCPGQSGLQDLRFGLDGHLIECQNGRILPKCRVCRSVQS